MTSKSALANLKKANRFMCIVKLEGRSSKAAKKLVDMGYQSVYNLDGGMDAWKSKGYERE